MRNLRVVRTVYETFRVEVAQCKIIHITIRFMSLDCHLSVPPLPLIAHA